MDTEDMKEKQSIIEIMKGVGMKNIFFEKTT